MELNAIIESTPNPGVDDTAKDELKYKYSEKKRNERVANVFNWAFVVFVAIVSLATTGIVTIRLVHLVLPSSKQWLTELQVQGIDKIFFSGAIGGILVNYFKKSNVT